MLREEEKIMENLTGYRVKYVEKAGTSIGDLLCRSDHWAGRLCGREACLLCNTKQATGENLRQSCTKRNVVYEIWCHTCKQADERRAEEQGRDAKKIKIFKYIGESAKSAYERGLEHQRDRTSLSTKSHMLKHAVDRHEGADPEKLEFRMKVLRYHRSAFERQVSESQEIKRNSKHHILNSKGEYNRCALPRLGLKMGTKEYSRAKEEEDKETEKEKNIEDKIKYMKRMAGKRTRGREKKESSAPKRRKMTEENGYMKIRTSEMPRVIPNSGEKRAGMPDTDIDSQPKIKRIKTSQQDIRGFIISGIKNNKINIKPEGGTAQPVTECDTAQQHTECGTDCQQAECGTGHRQSQSNNAQHVPEGSTDILHTVCSDAQTQAECGNGQHVPDGDCQCVDSDIDPECGTAKPEGSGQDHQEAECVHSKKPECCAAQPIQENGQDHHQAECGSVQGAVQPMQECGQSHQQVECGSSHVEPESGIAHHMQDAC